MTEPTVRGPVSNLVGRRRGKKLRAYHSALMREELPHLGVDLTKFDFETIAKNYSAVWVEVGFGGGEHLAEQANQHPEILFLGCEPFENGVAKLLAEIHSRQLNNVLIHMGDALQLLAILPAVSVSRVYMLFPDPWPKRRQKKRRFVNTASLNQLARILKPAAELRFATDIDDYAGWTLARIAQNKAFKWRCETPSEWLQPWPGHTTTRYEQRAGRNGDAPVYLTFTKVS